LSATSATTLDTSLETALRTEEEVLLKKEMSLTNRTTVSIIHTFLTVSGLVNESDMVALKIRGMPYRATVEEITDFFKDYKFIENSVIYGYGSDGRKNGFGAIVFESEEQASSACDALQKQNIGSRWV